MLPPFPRNQHWLMVQKKLLSQSQSQKVEDSKEQHALQWKRKFNGKKHVYQVIVGPIFDVLRIMGRAPFYRDDTGRMQFKYVSFIMIYSVLMNLVVSISSAISIIEIFQFFTVTFNKKVESVLGIAIIMPQLITPAIGWMQMNSAQRYLNLWSEFQDQYEEVTHHEFPRVNKLRPAYSSLLIYILMTVAIVFIVVPTVYMSDILRWHHIPGFYFSALGNAMHFAYWVITSRVVAKISEEFYLYFHQEISKDKGYTLKVEEYRLLWMQLSHVVRECGSTSSIVVSIFILSTTFTLVLIFYISICTIPIHTAEQNYSRIIYDVIINYFWWAALKIYCDSGYLMTDSCTNHSLENVLHLKKRNSLEEELYLNIFFFTLKHYPPQASVSDFYVVDRALFGNIVTSLITYIIVLVQFHVNGNI